MRVFLIGYMGVGKSTIGKKLAVSLGLKFMDLDKFISTKTGVSVPNIIVHQGEEYFRNIEKNSLQELASFSDVLISTGGGTPCFFDNMEVIQNKGVSVYLEMDTKSLAKRLNNSQSSRPLLKGKSLEELEVFVEEHLSSRLPFYKKADITINALNVNGVKIKELAQTIAASR